MGLFLLSIGGALGSLARFSLGLIVLKKTKTTFPLATFLINITGAILLGLVSGMNIGGNMYLLLADGFLGAYTTFSTFMFDGVYLFQKSKKANAFCYVFGTLVLGIIGFVLGLLLGGQISII